MESVMSSRSNNRRKYRKKMSFKQKLMHMVRRKCYYIL